MNAFRWNAIIVYRSELGLVEVDHHFEEMDELHDLVESGPDWNTIEKIEVRLSPQRTSYPNDTVEASEKRR